MIHARADYDRRIQDSAGLIPDDEPVLLVRGQDACAPATIEAWLDEAHERGAADDVIAAVEQHGVRVRRWQREHGSKLPDLPVVVDAEILDERPAVGHHHKMDPGGRVFHVHSGGKTPHGHAAGEDWDFSGSRATPSESWAPAEDASTAPPPVRQTAAELVAGAGEYLAEVVGLLQRASQVAGSNEARLFAAIEGRVNRAARDCDEAWSYLSTVTIPYPAHLLDPPPCPSGGRGALDDEVRI